MARDIFADYKCIYNGKVHFEDGISIITHRPTIGRFIINEINQFCQQLINFIDDKSTDGWTMSNNTNTIINSQPRISLKQHFEDD